MAGFEEFPLLHQMKEKHFDAIYRTTELTATRIISQMDCEELSAADGKITTWLHRYLRSLDQPSLKLIVRYITATECLFPWDTIAVKFVDSANSKEHLAPTSLTRFKVLHVPRQYASFFDLRDSFNKYVIASKTNWSRNG